MPRSCFLALVLVGLLCAPADAARAQSAEATQERLEALKAQIAAAEDRLAAKTQKRQASLATLEDLNRQIALREELVASYRRRLAQLRQSSDSLRTSLDGLDARVGELKKSYRTRATHAYMYGRLHDVALILAAESINEMLMRVFYLHHFTQERRQQLEALHSAAAEMRKRRETLAAKRERTVALLRETQSERENLTRLQASRRQVVEQLRAQSASLEDELEEKRTAARRLEARVRRLLAAARAQRQRERTTASPAERAAERARFEALTGSFRQNRGNLPWPAQGAVVEDFGMIVNPVHGTETPNPGLFIATPPQAPVRAVFEGEIVSIDAMPGYGTLVAVRHGKYLTVYANFSMLYVTEGAHVEAGQLLGRAGTEAEPRGAGLFFGLFNDGEAVDPAPWLRNR